MLSIMITFVPKVYLSVLGRLKAQSRYIPQKRLKIPGATWHPDTVNPMLALRIIRANGWWDDFWMKQSASAHKPYRSLEPTILTTSHLRVQKSGTNLPFTWSVYPLKNDLVTLANSD